MDLAQIPELELLTWMEARDLLALRPVGFLPIGAIEAHGPHLPLNSDVIIARGMAKSGARLLQRNTIPVVVLPAIAYSVSFAGSCFPGTIPVSSDSLESYLTDTLTSLAGQGFRAICISNAHLEPVHVETIRRSVELAEEKSSCPIIFPDQRVDQCASLLGEEFTGGSRHAGSYETSIVMAEDSRVVRRTELEELEPVWIDLPAALAAGARDFKEAGASHGYFGDPASATVEEGVRLLDILGKMLTDHVLEALSAGDSGRKNV